MIVILKQIEFNEKYYSKCILQRWSIGDRIDSLRGMYIIKQTARECAAIQPTA